MTNFESGKKLLKEADECFEEMISAFQRGSWNMVIRRAQEVIELNLKGILKIIGVEYPKVHDPAKYFLEIAEKKGLGVDKENGEQIKRISADLSEKRAPAFYYEKDYTEKDAIEAKKGAEFIKRFIKSLSERLK